MLFLGEERGEPEEDGTTQYTEAHQVDAVDAVKHGILAYRSHQSQNAPEQKRHRWAIRGRLLSIFPYFYLNLPIFE